MIKAAKSTKRIEVIDKILNTIADPKIYKTIDYVRYDENYIKQYIYQPLIRCIKNIHVKRGLTESRALTKAEKSLLWEGNKETTVSNLQFLGCSHRPDMALEINGMNLAIEFKKGGNGSSLREGIGQAIVYTSKYDFVIYLLIDTTKDKSIQQASKNPLESKFINDLWNHHNVYFKIVS